MYWWMPKPLNAFHMIVMQDEIFGPILPIISYQEESEIEKIISKYEKPLSLYVFSNNTNNISLVDKPKPSIVNVSVNVTTNVTQV